MKKALLFIGIITLLSACRKDNPEIIPGQDFIPDEVLEEIIDNGQPVYEGVNPPDLTGTYFISPLALVESNFDDNSSPGTIFSPEEITFYDYNEDDLTIKVSYEQGNSSGDALGSFISGEDNNFTIYVRVDANETDGGSYLFTKVVSGTFENDGIRDVSMSVFMVDDNGDPDGDLIENGQGRRFIDGDGFSPKI